MNSQQSEEGSSVIYPLEEHPRKQGEDQLDDTAHNSGNTDRRTQPDSLSLKSHCSVSAASNKKSEEDFKIEQVTKVIDKLTLQQSNTSQRESYSTKISAHSDASDTNQKYSPEVQQSSTDGSSRMDSGKPSLNYNVSPSPLSLFTDESSHVPTYTDEPRTRSLIISDPLPVASNLLCSKSKVAAFPLSNSVQFQEPTETACVSIISSGSQASGSQHREMCSSSQHSSSIDHSQGYSTGTEESKVLSSLMGPSDVSLDGGTARLGRSEEREKLVVVDTHHATPTASMGDRDKIVCIQAHFRGYATRRWFRTYLRQNKAAALIQSAWLVG